MKTRNIPESMHHRMLLKLCSGRVDREVAEILGVSRYTVCNGRINPDWNPSEVTARRIEKACGEPRPE